MNREHAIKLAILALETQRQRIAAEANLADVYGAGHQSARTASKTRREINEAIDELRKIREELRAARNKPILEALERKKKRTRPHRETQIPLFGEIDEH